LVDCFSLLGYSFISPFVLWCLFTWFCRPVGMM
jgi:hypothetical protein